MVEIYTKYFAVTRCGNSLLEKVCGSERTIRVSTFRTAFSARRQENEGFQRRSELIVS